MSHMIDTSNDRNNMAYKGRVPWHGLGQVMEEGATIEEWRVAAGLNWELEARPVFHGIVDSKGRKKAQVIDGRKALVRSDTDACLSIMSDRYQIVQPETIMEFYRDLVEGSRFTIETAGSLKGGAKIWALARGNLDLRIAGQDLIKPYLLLATTCDGTMSTIADFTSVRVVCHNTLTMAVGANGAKANIRIPHSTTFDPEAVKVQLGLVDERFETFATDVDTLSQTKMSNAEAIQFFISQYAKVDADGEVKNEKTLTRVTEKLTQLFLRGPGADLRSAKGTAWGAVNAITRFEDFDSSARTNGNRFNKGQFGSGANRKAAAFNSALVLAA